MGDTKYVENRYFNLLIYRDSDEHNESLHKDGESDSWVQSDLEEELVHLREEEQEQEHHQDILNLLQLVQCSN